MKLLTIWKTKEPVYFLYHYEPIRQRIKMKNWGCEALNFKLYNHNAFYYKIVIKAIKQFLDCDVSVACPGHRMSAINIQKITDRSIYFSPKFERLPKHKIKIKNLIDIEEKRIEIIQNREVASALLCDDIRSTGETLNIYEFFLKEKCKVKRVEKFVVGNKKTEESEKAFMIAITDILDDITSDMLEIEETFWLTRDNRGY